MPADQVKVLVVEDEPAQREMLVYNLEKEGYQVHVAGDGEGCADHVVTVPAKLFIGYLMQTGQPPAHCNRSS